MYNRVRFLLFPDTLLFVFPWSYFVQGYCSLDQIPYRRDVCILCQTSRVASLIIRIMFPQRYFLPRSFPAPAVMLAPAIYPKVCFFFWFSLFLLVVPKVSSSYPSFINNSLYSFSLHFESLGLSLPYPYFYTCLYGAVLFWVQVWPIL